MACLAGSILPKQLAKARLDEIWLFDFLESLDRLCPVFLYLNIIWVSALCSMCCGDL